MKNHHFWIEILLLGTLTACALLFATLAVAVGVTAVDAIAQQEPPSVTQQAYEGMVTCSRCGARHSGVLWQNAADCARICVRGGARFALVEPDATYLLDGDLGVLGRLAGQRARIVGELNGKTIRISSAVPQS